MNLAGPTVRKGNVRDIRSPVTLTTTLPVVLVRPSVRRPGHVTADRVSARCVPECFAPDSLVKLQRRSSRTFQKTPAANRTTYICFSRPSVTTVPGCISDSPSVTTVPGYVSDGPSVTTVQGYVSDSPSVTTVPGYVSDCPSVTKVTGYVSDSPSETKVTG